MSEEELIDKTIDMLAQLDEYLEKLTDNNVEEELIFSVKCNEDRISRLEQWYFELPTKFVKLPKDIEE